jgi:serine/threonine-protein kinase
MNNLAKAARGLGDAEGVAEAQRGLTELRNSDPAYASFDTRLAAIIKGDQKPRNEAERLALAQRAYEKALHASAARFWAEALAADPKLAADRKAQTRYNAACAAALAGCGQSKDAPPPDETAKTKLRKQSLAWLKDELAVWSKLLESGGSAARPLVTQTMEHWQSDPDLAGVREEAELAKLPEPEREAWRKVWGEAAGVLKSAR